MSHLRAAKPLHENMETGKERPGGRVPSQSRFRASNLAVSDETITATTQIKFIEIGTL